MRYVRQGEGRRCRDRSLVVAPMRWLHISLLARLDYLTVYLSVLLKRATQRSLLLTDIRETGSHALGGCTHHPRDRVSATRLLRSYLIPDTSYLLRVVTALASIASLTRSLARPGQEPGVSLLLAVVRTTNEPPRQPKIPPDGGGISTLHYVRDVWFWPSHSCLPSSRISPSLCSAKTPRGHTLAAKHTQGVVPVSLCMACRIVQWTRRLPCAACMHAAEACVRACVDQRTSASKSSDG